MFQQFVRSPVGSHMLSAVFAHRLELHDLVAWECILLSQGAPPLPVREVKHIGDVQLTKLAALRR